MNNTFQSPRSIEHDDYTLYYTQEAIDDNAEIIGFYFDACNHPQMIIRESHYGSIIQQYLHEMKMMSNQITLSYEEISHIIKVVYIRKIKDHKVLDFTNDKNTITKLKNDIFVADSILEICYQQMKLRAEKANK